MVCSAEFLAGRESSTLDCGLAMFHRCERKPWGICLCDSKKQWWHRLSVSMSADEKTRTPQKFPPRSQAKLRCAGTIRQRIALEFERPKLNLFQLSPLCTMTPLSPEARANVHLIDHPLVQHKLTLMRNKTASTNSFRRLLNELSSLMAYEVTRDMATQDIEIETPLEAMTAKVIDGKKLVFVSILRAGNGILDGVLSVVPGARVGHIGLYRDPATLQAVEYYFKMPKNMEERDIIVVDPMLATGNSAAAAVTRLKACKPKSIKFLCLLTAPEGIEAMHKAHPDVAIYTAAIDRELNDHGYILPGLGDAGDRIFGTQ